MFNNVLERSLVDYKYLEKMSKNDWAWEFTRRNPKYILSWKHHLKRQKLNINSFPKFQFTKDEMKKAELFGLLFYINPSLSSKEVDVFWSPNITPHVLKCSSIEHNHSVYNEGVILADIELELIYIETFDGLSHLILKDKNVSLQLLFDVKLDLNTFFDFEIRLPAFCNLTKQIQSAKCLDEFLSYQKCKHFQSLSSAKSKQYIKILFAYDLANLKVSQRNIFKKIYGEEANIDVWDGLNESGRKNIRRLISKGRELIKTGHKTFF